MSSIDYIHKNIQKKYINGKGYGFIAIDHIPKNTIILSEYPSFMIDKYKPSQYDMFELIYNILNSNNKSKSRFMNYMPNSINDNYKQIIDDIKNVFKKLKSYNKHIYDFLINNYSMDDIILLSLKYISNAFDFFDEGPIILLTGSIFNHSCSPNIILGKYCSQDNKKPSKMIFTTIRDIKKGEEICDSYIDIFSDHYDRTINIKKRYGFTCMCDRCINDNQKKIYNLKKSIRDTKNNGNLIYNHF